MTSKLGTWLLLAMIFVVGGVTGSCLTLAFAPSAAHPPPFQQMRNHWLNHLARKLDLTPDQIAKIEPIITDAETQMKELHRDEVGRLSQIMKSVNQQIVPILTQEQKEVLRKIDRDRERTLGPGGMRRDMPPMPPNGPAEGPPAAQPGMDSSPPPAHS